ncbi:hypothetical protein GCM10022206_10930 [Streptomyces chiangmaiensis]
MPHPPLSAACGTVDDMPQVGLNGPRGAAECTAVALSPAVLPDSAAAYPTRKGGTEYE